MSTPRLEVSDPRGFFPTGDSPRNSPLRNEIPPPKWRKRWNVDTEVQQTVECKECWPPSTANGGMLTLKYSQRWHVTFDRSIWHWSTANQRNLTPKYSKRRNVRNVAPQVQPAVTCHFWQVNLTLKYSQNGCTSVSNALIRRFDTEVQQELLYFSVKFYK